MLRKLYVTGLIAAATAFSVSPVFAADPSIDQVYQAAQSGHLGQAQTMMAQVLKDHPNSGKAHFVEAELLAKQGRLDTARTELATAQRLAPGLPFAKPAAVTELDNLLAPHTSAPRVAAPMMAAAPAQHSGMPMGLIFLAIGGLAILAFIMFQRSRTTVIQQVPMGGSYGPQPGATYGGGYGPTGGPMPYGGMGGGGVMGGGGGIGSGIVGGLATGAAVGVGVVAGEALMHRVLDGGSHETVVNNVVDPSGGWTDNSVQNYDMGGNDFGVNDTSSWDDGSSSVDDDSWN